VGKVNNAAIFYIYFLLLFQLHLAALTSLKREISDLTGRLHAALQERQVLEAALSKLEVILKIDLKKKKLL